MGRREDNVEVFRDTMAWVEDDSRLGEAVRRSTQLSEVYFEDDYPPFDDSRTCDGTVEVSGERTGAAAMRLVKELPGAHVAVLNFANAFQPGGGVTWGSGAQEESLCRISTLYPVISANADDSRRSFYRHHRELGRSEATDSLIWSPGVVFCKSDDDAPQRLPEQRWTTADVVTMAAPDLRKLSMADAVLFGYHVRRALHLLDVAAAKGADVLVLGAFGCGAFRNDPRVVARAWHVALGEFPRVFRRVQFAIKGNQSSMRHIDSDNLRAFQEEFAAAGGCTAQARRAATYDLQRFRDAQERDYATALAELRQGRKRSHWIWYVFPQLRGLGRSRTSDYYGIAGAGEAQAYLADPVLGPRLVEACEALLGLGETDPRQVMGYPDDLKLRSSMTLFEAAAREAPDACPGTEAFGQVLERYYDGSRDERTLALLRAED